jgi:hypothetical protein
MHPKGFWMFLPGNSIAQKALAQAAAVSRSQPVIGLAGGCSPGALELEAGSPT